MHLSLLILLLFPVALTGRPAVQFVEREMRQPTLAQPTRLPILQDEQILPSVYAQATKETDNTQRPIIYPEIASSQLSHSPRTGQHIVIEGHNITVGEYLWSGRTGEYYDIPGGWPERKGDVVAKEFYIWYWPHELTRELDFLSRTGQLVGHGKFEGFQWLIMHKPPGVHLTKTTAFKEAYQKGRQECDTLVENIYEPAFYAIIDLIRRYGIYHHVLNARMLWDDEATNPQIFDMGDDTNCDPKVANDSAVRNQVALDVYTAWPNDGISYQDWCVNGQKQ